MPRRVIVNGGQMIRRQVHNRSAAARSHFWARNGRIDRNLQDRIGSVGGGIRDCRRAADDSALAADGLPPCLQCIAVRLEHPVVVRGPSDHEPDAPISVIKLPDGTFRGFIGGGTTLAVDGADACGAQRPRTGCPQAGTARKPVGLRPMDHDGHAGIGRSLRPDPQRNALQRSEWHSINGCRLLNRRTMG